MASSADEYAAAVAAAFAGGDDPDPLGLTDNQTLEYDDTRAVCRAAIRRIADGEMLFTPIGGELVENPFITEKAREGARRRVIDAVELYRSITALTDEWPFWQELLANSYSRPGGGRMFTAEHLPLVSAPRIGITGIWQTSVGNVLVTPGEAPDEFYFCVLGFAGPATPSDGLGDLDLVARSVLIADSLVACVTADGETVSYGFQIMGGETADRWKSSMHGTARLVHIAVATVLLGCGIAQARPDSVINRSVPKRLARKHARNGHPLPATETEIRLPGLRYDPRRRSWSADAVDGSGVRWHLVRGFFRELRSERFTTKRGQKVWVAPHSRGNADLGVSSRGYRVEP